MRKLFTVLCFLLCLMVCTTAGADWICKQPKLDGTVCGQVNEDGSEWCIECGFNEPVHDLSAGRVGSNFIQLKWYGVQEEPMLLFWCVSGSSSWQVIDDITGNSYLLKDLQPGTSYNFELSTADMETVGKVTVSTVTDTTPVPESTAEPTAEPTKEPSMAEPTRPVPEEETEEPEEESESGSAEHFIAGHAASTNTVAVGEYITFGHYPQTADGTDNTPIEWLVLEVNTDKQKALVISRYGLDAMQYNSEKKNVTWENCTLRAWLNDTFLNTAFTEEEQSAILTTTVSNSKSQCYSGWSTKNKGGDSTQDQIFLLSYAQAHKYFDV